MISFIDLSCLKFNNLLNSYFPNNQLTGTIPTELGKLTKLWRM